MELQTTQPSVSQVRLIRTYSQQMAVKSTVKPFLEANTKEVELNHLKSQCIVPVFSKDNEMTISHSEFISSVVDAANAVFRGERILAPQVRVSHSIKGRTPDALHKPAAQLLDSEKTLYYERMMFCIEVATIKDQISGNELTLTIGGVRAYNHENLFSRKGVERFKVFVGFQNRVCCNMCVATDGYLRELKVMSPQELFNSVVNLLRRYDTQNHLQSLRQFENYSLSEHQFAQLLGKTRMYQHLPSGLKKELPELLMTDTQINLIAKAYYSDENFSGSKQGEVGLWSLYNMMTGANKSSYIDQFLDRLLNAFEFTSGIAQALQSNSPHSWFLQ